MALVWKGDEAEKRTREDLAKGLLRGAVFFENAHRSALSTSFPPASVPGEYPHGRTWNLRDAVTHEPQAPAEVARTLRIRLGYPQNAFYGLILELFRKRKGLLDTMERVRAQVAALIGPGGKT
jgi:hypothetical protein